ncbi:diguanylate cyclase domain protein [Vibrio cholerae HE-40]|uniref:putative bifunctional diguanylate cyclase/phosphodiesterase n=1 Tax=Vibrio cholerae TaxID=666 RepID=UPI000218F78D|nr:EAL domain-containing protein [Vibrio cholerae]EGR03938.1 sensory box protein [Vibrio cholerae HE39]EKL33363.1 diguanylate cyclase domain protein [Vibrio cholerae HE-40]EKL37287.1 diguanylate cyclase domain protein [Vibrio cholerae HE-46]ORP20908.1 GGDEF domain-containing protein [Vibrio cholerae]
MPQNFKKLKSGAFYIVQRDAAGQLSLPVLSKSITLLLGYSVEQLSSEPELFFSRIHADDFARVNQEMAASKQELAVFQSEYRFQHAEGHWLWLATQAEPEQTDDGLRWRGFIYDISKQKQTEERLLLALLDGQLLLDHMMDAVITTDKQGLIQSFNPAAQRLFGYTKQEVLGKNVAMLMPATHARRHDGYLAEYQQTQVPKIIGNRRKLEALHRDGSLISIELRISDVMSQSGNRYLAVIRDLREQENSGEIRRLRYLDPLTNLPDRFSLLSELQSIQELPVLDSTHYALLLIDIRNFKKLNEWLTYPHGDEVLRLVAARLRQLVTASRILARTGPDEFALLISAATQSAEQFNQLCDEFTSKVLQLLRQPLTIFERELTLAFNIGVAVMEEGVRAENWLKAAEIALAHAKLTETADHILLTPELARQTIGRSQLELELRQALVRQELQLFLQGKFGQQKQLLGAEVLLRWQHPMRGWVSPAEFIPLAEETELIEEIGFWVLEQSCMILQQWQQQPETAHLELAVNISSRQFSSVDFIATTQRLIAQYQINPQLLHLELTESLLINNADDVVDKMMQLNSKGLSFALDDFGTGYSSLSYLKRLPLQMLKIDRSFVRDMHQNPSDRVLANTIILMAKGLGMGVIAEGVEDELHFEMLSEMGCSNFQGYYLHKPVPLQQFQQQFFSEQSKQEESLLQSG